MFLMKDQEKLLHSHYSGMLNQVDLIVIPGEDTPYLIMMIMFLHIYLDQVIQMSFIAV